MFNHFLREKKKERKRGETIALPIVFWVNSKRNKINNNDSDK